MNADRWQKVNELFHQALKYKISERGSFLESACQGDNKLLEEVNKLLSASEQADDFIQKPAFSQAINLLKNQPEASSLVGEKLNRYRIISQIGEGGMGKVYLARDPQLSRNVAIKVLLPEIAQDEDRVRRFKLEAHAASSLNHPNIITIFEIGKSEDQIFIVYEYIEGKTLREKIERNQLTFPECIKIVRQIGGALEVSHKEGIIHRDIKPENIMIRPDGYIKILDFGLAKKRLFNFDKEEDTLEKIKTQKGIIMGSVQYMSPEQARGREIDERSDIWSLGVVLYEMLTGKNPFAGETITDSIGSILHIEPQSIQRFNSNFPLELDRILEKALAKDLFNRYQNVKELLFDLNRINLVENQDLSEKRTIELVSTKGLVLKDTNENETKNSNPDKSTFEKGKVDNKTAITSVFKGKIVYFVLLLVLIVSVGFIFNPWFSFLSGWFYPSKNLSQPVSDTAKIMAINQITTNGKATGAAISPDGKYIAYVQYESGKAGLWVRHVPTSRNIQIVAPSDINLGSLTFSSDGNYIFYLKVNFKISQSEVYMIPVLGGTQKKVAEKTDNFFAISPNNKQIVFSRFSNNQEEAFMIVADLGGGNEKTIATRKNDEWLDFASWAPDGQKIAFVAGKIESKDEGVRIKEINLETLEEKTFPTNNWTEITRLVWKTDGSGVLVIGKRTDVKSSAQIWSLSYPDCEIRRVTNDLNNYSSLSISADSKNLVAVQSVYNSGIWIAPFDDLTSGRQITSGSGSDGAMGLTWTPDGKIVYSTRLDDKYDIWTIDSEGNNQNQLTSDSGINVEPVVSPDGQFIVFVSNRSGKFQLWRMNIDGSNPVQLTNTTGGRLPKIFTDGKWIVYQSLFLDKDGYPENNSIYKVSIEGGTPVQIVESPSSQPDVSPDGKYIAFFSAKSISIIPFGGGEPQTILEIPKVHLHANMELRTFVNRMPFFHWLPDSSGLVFVKFENGEGSIWKILLNRKIPERISDFDANVNYFDWSKDGKKLAYPKFGVAMNNVVMISNL
jgi:eukaryotic-like serine/threonine-protein kinase